MSEQVRERGSKGVGEWVGDRVGGCVSGREGGSEWVNENVCEGVGQGTSEDVRLVQAKVGVQSYQPLSQKLISPTRDSRLWYRCNMHY